MKKKKLKLYHFITILISFLSLFGQSLFAQKGIVAVPVADLVGQPIQTFNPKIPAHTSYQHLSWSARGSDYDACPRIHQLLLHEVVDIIEYKKDEVCIRIPNVYYQTKTSKKPHTEYWTLRKNIISLDQLKKRHIDSKKIPSPICFDRTNQSCYQNSVVLIEPYLNPITQTTLSVGTRFIKTEKQPHKDNVMVYCLNPQHLTLDTCVIPKEKLYQWCPKPFEERIKDFIIVLKKWIHANGTIPYVWGGCSFTQTHASNRFYLGYTNIRGKKRGFYRRPHDANGSAKTGFDCSSIIMRAAQIVGIPYFFKNTYTIAQKVPPLSPNESLKLGDIIWIQGHVLVVSDIQNNRAIEAHAYDSGYGKIHEIPIKNVFKGITTFTQLEKAYRNQAPLQRLDSKGVPFCTYKQFKLLRLPRS